MATGGNKIKLILKKLIGRPFKRPVKKARRPVYSKNISGKPKGRGKFQKVQRKTFKVPSTWQQLDTLKLCREAGISRKLAARGWLEYTGSIGTYINPRIKSALGYANYQRGTIELNQRYIKNAGLREKMLQTFVHEVAHHLTHEFLEHMGHGEPWKETMVWLGYNPARLGDMRH